MSNKDSNDQIGINCPYLNVTLNKKVIIKGYIDSGATVSLLSDKSLSNRERKSLKPFTARVSDANGKPIPIIGVSPIKIDVQTQTIRTRILIFRKNDELSHDLLVGMNILKAATLDFVNKKIYFGKNITENKTHPNRCTNDCLTLCITDNCIYYPESLHKRTAVHLTSEPEVNTNKKASTTTTKREVNRRNTADDHACDTHASGQVNDTLACDHPASNSADSDAECHVAGCSRESSLGDIKNNAEYRIHCTDDNLVNVHLNQNLRIPSNTLMTVSVTVNRGIKSNADLLVYPNVIKKSIILASVLTHTMSSNVTLQLINLSDKEINLNSGTKLSEGIYVDNERVTILPIWTCHFQLIVLNCPR